TKHQAPSTKHQAPSTKHPGQHSGVMMLGTGNFFLQGVIYYMVLAEKTAPPPVAGASNFSGVWRGE
ncbi:MAG: hypothetical protein ORN51_04610, partial [Akkermansiaceae bacterium]|nr:hypothetical protein [Akkermansiaceae bacterium]